MIAVQAPHSPLAPVEAFGLETLLDLSRLIPAPVPDPRLPALRIVPGPSDPADDVATIAVSPGRAGTEVLITTGLLAAAGRLAGAWVEQGSALEDRHGRTPSHANPICAGGRWREALVSRAGVALREAVAAVAPERAALRLVPAWPEGRSWAAILTHDLDLVAGWPLAAGLRVTELLRHGAPLQAARVVAAGAGAIAGAPVERAMHRLLERLGAAGVRSTWFILCGTPTLATWRRGDLTYRPESPRVRKLLESVRAAGHQVGLHGSFATRTDAVLLAGQRTRLEALVDGPVRAVRQHFLRMRPGATQRAMVEAGFTVDATFGFADRSGFRLGTADLVPAWDREHDRALPLAELPLHWMDRTLSKYAGVEDPEAWVADGLERAAEAETVGGAWCGLWHPNLSTPLGFPGAEAAFDQLLAGLASRRPWFATVHEAVEWRQLRRAVRAAPGGEGFVAPRALPVVDLGGATVAQARVAA